MPPVKTPFTLSDYIPKGFFGGDSSDDDPEEGEVAQCCMVSWADECEEAIAIPANTAQEVDQITLRSGRQLQPPKPTGKEEKTETTPEIPLISDNAKEKGGEEVIPSSSNSQGTAENRQATKDSKKDLPATTPFQVRQGSHKEKVRYDVISHLKRIPARLSVYDALQMSREIRRALIQALMDPDDYKDQVDPIEVDEVLSYPLNQCAACMACVTFSDEDLQLGSANHNRPLYVTGRIGDKRINRILLDCGSAVNLLPLRVLRAIGITPNQLSPTLLTIQGFNQVGQKALGTIALKVELDDLYTDALFHVIDADTSYNALLGRPWLHTSRVIASTLHQCLKYTDEHGNEKTIRGDTNPFHGEDVNYADAKFYKSADSGTSQVLLAQEKDNQKEKLKALTLPQKVIRVVNSYASEAKEYQALRSKVLFKYTPKEKRRAGQKALTPVKEIVNSLVTSYTFPLRRIDQSMPKENLVIRTSLGNKRVVLRGNTSNFSIEASSSNRPPPGGLSQSRRRKKANNKKGFDEANEQVNISHEGGALKASFQADVSEALRVSHDGGVLKAHATNDLVFTPQEQEMFFSTNEQVQP